MKPKNVAVLVGALTAIAAAIFVIDQPKPVPPDPRIGKPVVDASVVRNARELRVTNHSATVRLRWRPGEGWCDEDYYDFPVAPRRLARLIEGLTTTNVERLIATSPSGISRLEFGGASIELLDPAGRAIESIDLGKEGESSGRFIRFGGEPKAYFANLIVWLDMEPVRWVDTTLLDLNPDRVAKIAIPLDGGPVTVAHVQGGGWKADRIPSGQRLAAESMDSLLAVLRHITFSATRDLGDPSAAEARAHAQTYTVTTLDGGVTTVAFGRAAGDNRAKPTDHGPAFVWISGSDPKAAVNVLMKRRVFEVPGNIFDYLPLQSSDLFESVSESGKKPPRQRIPFPPPMLD